MGADYSQYNLNDQLQSKDSLAVKSDYVTSTSFDANYEGLSAIKVPNTLQIIKRGTSTLTFIYTGTQVDSSNVVINHNLGFRPFPLVWTGGTTAGGINIGNIPFPVIGLQTVGTGLNVTSSYEVTSVGTNTMVLTVTFAGNGAAGTNFYEFPFYLLKPE